MAASPFSVEQPRAPEAAASAMAMPEPQPATSPDDEAMTTTVEADGGVVDLREARAATPVDVLEAVPANFRTEELPTPALFAAASEDTPVETPAFKEIAAIPDVEIPEWLRAEPIRAEMAPATASAPLPATEPEAAEPEVALAPFSDETPPRGMAEVVENERSARQDAARSEVAEVVDVAEVIHEPAAEVEDTRQAASADFEPPEVGGAPVASDADDVWDQEEPHSAPDASVYAADEAFDWATSAVTATHAIDHGAALAEALEAIATRLRNGELDASLYRADMSDAAALTAALAAVLGVRR